MKTLLFLLCIIALCNCQINREFIRILVKKIRKVSEECITQSHASRDAIRLLLEHKIPESHEGKCMIFCFHKHFYIQNEDGSLNRETTIATLEPLKQHNEELYEKVIGIFDKCESTVPVDNDPCLYAANLGECGIREGESMGLTDELLVLSKNKK